MAQEEDLKNLLFIRKRDKPSEESLHEEKRKAIEDLQEEKTKPISPNPANHHMA